MAMSLSNSLFVNAKYVFWLDFMILIILSIETCGADDRRERWWTLWSFYAKNKSRKMTNNGNKFPITTYFYKVVCYYRLTLQSGLLCIVNFHAKKGLYLEK